MGDDHQQQLSKGGRPIWPASLARRCLITNGFPPSARLPAPLQDYHQQYLSKGGRFNRPQSAEKGSKGAWAGGGMRAGVGSWRACSGLRLARLTARVDAACLHTTSRFSSMPLLITHPLQTPSAATAEATTKAAAAGSLLPPPHTPLARCRRLLQMNPCRCRTARRPLCAI